MTDNRNSRSRRLALLPLVAALLTACGGAAPDDAQSAPTVVEDDAEPSSRALRRARDGQRQADARSETSDAEPEADAAPEPQPESEPADPFAPYDPEPEVVDPFAPYETDEPAEPAEPAGPTLEAESQLAREMFGRNVVPFEAFAPGYAAPDQIYVQCTSHLDCLRCSEEVIAELDAFERDISCKTQTCWTVDDCSAGLECRPSQLVDNPDPEIPLSCFEPPAPLGTECIHDLECESGYCQRPEPHYGGSGVCQLEAYRPTICGPVHCGKP